MLVTETSDHANEFKPDTKPAAKKVVAGKSAAPAGLQGRIQNKLSQLEQLQYELTKQVEAYASNVSLCR